MDEKKSKKSEKPKSEPVLKPRQAPKTNPLTTPLFEVCRNERGLLKALKKQNLLTVEDLKPLTDAQILAIPGVQDTRFKKVLKIIGRKSEAEQTKEALRNG